MYFFFEKIYRYFLGIRTPLNSAEPMTPPLLTVSLRPPCKTLANVHLMKYDDQFRQIKKN